MGNYCHENRCSIIENEIGLTPKHQNLGRLILVLKYISSRYERRSLNFLIVGQSYRTLIDRDRTMI
jgi:hypothetical protein